MSNHLGRGFLVCLYDDEDGDECESIFNVGDERTYETKRKNLRTTMDICTHDPLV